MPLNARLRHTHEFSSHGRCSRFPLDKPPPPPWYAVGVGSALSTALDNTACRRGFSLIELVMVIGVILVLVGLAMPSLQHSMETARTTADAASLRQAAILIQTYSTDHREAFPLARADAMHNASHWGEALAAAGTVGAESEIDPWATKRSFPNRFWMSACMAADPTWFVQTLDPDLIPARVVFTHEVAYPSLKGLAVRAHDGREALAPPAGNWFCCGPLWESPVAMADGSMRIGDYTEFAPPGFFLQHGLLGMPVISTWSGVYGRDIFEGSTR